MSLERSYQIQEEGSDAAIERRKELWDKFSDGSIAIAEVGDLFPKNHPQCAKQVETFKGFVRRKHVGEREAQAYVENRDRSWYKVLLDAAEVSEIDIARREAMQEDKERDEMKK